MRISRRDVCAGGGMREKAAFVSLLDAIPLRSNLFRGNTWNERKEMVQCWTDRYRPLKMTIFRTACGCGTFTLGTSSSGWSENGRRNDRVVKMSRRVLSPSAAHVMLPSESMGAFVGVRLEKRGEAADSRNR